MKLTEKQKEILKELKWFFEKPEQSRRSNGFCTPMDVGGADGSHHSRVLIQLSKKGLIDVKLCGWFGGSKAYKLNSAGLEKLKELQHD